VDRDARIDFRYEFDDVGQLVEERLEGWIEESALEEDVAAKHFEAKVNPMKELVPIVYRRLID